MRMCVASEYVRTGVYTRVRTGALSGNIDVGEIPQTKFWKKIPEIQISENFKFWKNFFEKKKNSIKFSKILEIQIPETFPESYSLEKSQRVYLPTVKLCET